MLGDANAFTSYNCICKCNFLPPTRCSRGSKNSFSLQFLPCSISSSSSFLAPDAAACSLLSFPFQSQVLSFFSSSLTWNQLRNAFAWVFVCVWYNENDLPCLSASRVWSTFSFLSPCCTRETERERII